LLRDRLVLHLCCSAGRHGARITKWTASTIRINVYSVH
jgi:hypothetical protein